MRNFGVARNSNLILAIRIFVAVGITDVGTLKIK